MKIILGIIVTILFIFNSILVNGIFGFFNYIKYDGRVDTYQKPYVKLYKKLNEQVKGKNYFSEGENSIIIKKIYYLNGQEVDGTITFKDGTIEDKQGVSYNSLVKNHDKIKQVEINSVNGNIIDGKILIDNELLNKQANITTLE